MKKVLFLLLAVVLIAPSCNKEAPTIEGKWHLYKTVTISSDVSKEIAEDSYFEFAGGIVKDTNKYGYTNEFPYTFDKDNKKLTVGTLEYSVQKLTAKEMVWRFDGTTMTVIDGELVKIVEEYYDYFRKE